MGGSLDVHDSATVIFSPSHPDPLLPSTSHLVVIRLVVSCFFFLIYLFSFIKSEMYSHQRSCSSHPSGETLPQVNCDLGCGNFPYPGNFLLHMIINEPTVKS